MLFIILGRKEENKYDYFNPDLKEPMRFIFIDNKEMVNIFVVE